MLAAYVNQQPIKLFFIHIANTVCAKNGYKKILESKVQLNGVRKFTSWVKVKYCEINAVRLG